MVQSNDEYIPGKCNLGLQEIQSRKRKALIGFLISTLTITGLQFFHFHPAWRFIVFFPLSYAILCSFQAQQKFCVAFGIKGIFNFEEMRKSTIIKNTENKKKDNIKAWQIIFKSFFLAFIIVTIYFFLPL